MNDLHRKKIMKKRARRERAHLRCAPARRGIVRASAAVRLQEPALRLRAGDRRPTGQTLVAASSLEPDVRGGLGKAAGNKAAAKAVGEAVAERALAKGIEKVVFDRGGYVYHGKVKELAEGAREKGLAVLKASLHRHRELPQETE